MKVLLIVKTINHASALPLGGTGWSKPPQCSVRCEFAFARNRNRRAVESALPRAEGSGVCSAISAQAAVNPWTRQPQHSEHFGAGRHLVGALGANHLSRGDKREDPIQALLREPTALLANLNACPGLLH